MQRKNRAAVRCAFSLKRKEKGRRQTDQIEGKKAALLN
jgi:hypothetical protein